MDISIYTGRMDDIVECKYTPSLPTSSFSNYILSACTLLLFFCCSFHFLTPLFTLPSLLFLYLLFLLSFLFPTFLDSSLSSAFSPSSSSHFLIPLLLFPSPFPSSAPPIFTHCPWVFLLSYPFSSFLSNILLPTSYSFQLPSLPFYHLPSPLPLLCPIPYLPLLTCRTIRRSTWSTYTAGLTACAPRMKVPTSSSPPLPSI